MNISNSFLTIQEAADKLKVDYRTVYRKIHSGEIPAAKIGRVFRISTNDLEDYINKSKSFSSPAIKPFFTCSNCGKDVYSKTNLAGECEECGAPLCNECVTVHGESFCSEHQPVVSCPRITDNYSLAPITDPGFRNWELTLVARLCQQIEEQDSFYFAPENVFVKVSKRGFNPKKVRTPYKIFSARLLESVIYKLDNKIHIVIKLIYPLLNDINTGNVKEIQLQRLSEEIEKITSVKKQSNAVSVVLLVAPTGWTEAAKSLVNGKNTKQIFSKSNFSIALYDCKNDELIFNRFDKNFQKYYLPVLQPELQAKLIEKTVEYIKSQLNLRESISITETADELNIAESIAETAFAELNDTKQFKIMEIKKLGRVILKDD